MLPRKFWMLGLVWLIIALLKASADGLPVERDTQSLAGEWAFALGAPEPTIPQASLPTVEWKDRIHLPGTTETEGKGALNVATELGQLTRVRKFEGPAWYRREVDVPAGWEGRDLVLTLERTKYTQVWWDGQARGSQNLGTVAQTYALGRATPGKHMLVLLVDNRAERRLIKADVHQYSDNTQTNWNGVIGRIELAALPRNPIGDVQVFGDVAARALRVRVTLPNHSESHLTGRLSISAISFNHEGEPRHPAPLEKTMDLVGAAPTVELVYPLGPDARLWDEFQPALYRVEVVWRTEGGEARRVVETGLRDFRAQGHHFTINGRTTFLRGKHEACVFPLTGHPPMDVEGWIAYFRRCQEYGINHIRCHTWVPPEVAFAAADRLGLYLQPELPFWGAFSPEVRDALMPEAEALLKAYGNHPSFVMLTLGNEISGDRVCMNAMVTRLRELDPRHLYSDGSNNYFWDPRQQATNDFWTSAKVINPATNNQSVVARGSFCVLDGGDGFVQWGPGGTRADLSGATAGLTMPLVGHETGQWTSYPNFDDIKKFKGVVAARNLEHFRSRLEHQGMLAQAGEFARVTAIQAAELYKEENEMFLRTADMGGFQILDIQDFPGQGTALVGVLNAFMESKGGVTAARWRQSCSPVVVLARYDRPAWTADECFRADLQLAHYGREDWRSAKVSWTLKSSDGAVVAQGSLPSQDIVQGGLRSLGFVEAGLATVAAPARLDLAVRVESTQGVAENSWPLWVYPKANEKEGLLDAVLVRAWTPETEALLAAGRKVLLIPEQANWADTVGGAYATDYWCWPMFHNTPGTMGLLIDSHHPALAKFPTSDHSERQWTAIALASTPVILSGDAARIQPLVQVIDNLERNEKLGLVFEAKVGPGSLLVCAVDLLKLKDHPEARQLLTSLQAYAGAKAFSPTNEVKIETLRSMLRPSCALKQPVQASSVFKPSWGTVPTVDRAVDGDINTQWTAAEDDKTPTLTLSFDRIRTLDTAEIVWGSDEPGYGYRIEGSDDGKTWRLLANREHNSEQGGRYWVPLSGAMVRQVRLVTTSFPAGARRGISEFRLLETNCAPSP